MYVTFLITLASSNETFCFLPGISIIIANFETNVGLIVGSLAVAIPFTLKHLMSRDTAQLQSEYNENM